MKLEMWCEKALLSHEIGGLAVLLGCLYLLYWYGDAFL